MKQMKVRIQKKIIVIKKGKEGWLNTENKNADEDLSKQASISSKEENDKDIKMKKTKKYIKNKFQKIPEKKIIDEFKIEKISIFI